MSSRDDRERRRAAERAAARFLGEETGDADVVSDSPAGDRRAFASQLFVDGLLRGWGRGDTGTHSADRERRVARS